MLKLLAIIGLGLSVAACVATSPPRYLVAPADPTVVVRDPVYRPVTAGVKEYRVVDPLDWREQNRRVAPADNTGDTGTDSAAGARRAR